MHILFTRFLIVIRAIHETLSVHLFANRQLLFSYWPFFLGLGIVAYFSLSFEPSWQLALGLCLVLIGLFAACRRFLHTSALLYNVMHACIAFALGFFLATARTALLNTPFITQTYKNQTITATVVGVEHTKGVHNRYTLGDIDGMPTGESIVYARLKGGADLYLEPGWRVSCVATLLPITGAVSPVAYDFKRANYFAGIGANGRLKTCTILEKPSTNMAQLRFSITEAFRKHLKAPYGDIAAALVTGDRSGIPKDVRQQFTDAGLAHVLAISGLHLGLVAGIIFFATRRLLTLCYVFKDPVPTREISVMITIAAIAFYLGLSECGYPAIRSFGMTTLVMIGLIFNRNPLSMRSVALAASAILIMYPESLLSASFQLSFSAVIALIAAYDVCAQPLMDWSRKRPEVTFDKMSAPRVPYWLRRLFGYFCAIALTTVVATLATTPLSMAIFNRLTLQSVLGNLMAIPLTGFVIMPMAVIATVSFLFGGCDLAFQGFEIGIGGLVEIARYVSALPGAGLMVPTPRDWFYVFFVVGGLLLCLGPFRFVRITGLCFACFSVVFFFNHALPVGYFSGDRSVLVFYDKPTLYVSSLNRGQFYVDQWRQHLGIYPENVQLIPTQDRLWNGYHVIADPFRNLIDTAYTKWDAKKRYMRTITAKAPVLTNAYWQKKHWGHPTAVDANTLKTKGSAFIYPDGTITFASDFVYNRPWG